MKTLEQIAIKNLGSFMWDITLDSQKEAILSAMREACEQAIDECAKKADDIFVNQQSILDVKKLLK